MSATARKYEFTWDVIGTDMNVARPSLGPNTRIEVYRLFQFTMRDIIEQMYGTEVVDEIFYKAGVLAGKSFYEYFLKDATDVTSLVRDIQQLFKELGVGIFHVESFNAETLEAFVTVDEDLDCSGLPDNNDVICIYGEGFIAGILEGFSGKAFTVKEVDCWCTGARTCRFHAQIAE